MTFLNLSFLESKDYNFGKNPFKILFFAENFSKFSVSQQQEVFESLIYQNLGDVFFVGKGSSGVKETFDYFLTWKNHAKKKKS